MNGSRPWIVLTVLVTVACGATDASTQPGLEMPSNIHTVTSELDDLPRRWARLAASFDVPGMAVAVVQQDRVLFLGGFGHRAPNDAGAVDADTYFYIASSTKSMVAMAIMTLVESGAVELDAPVTRYLPELRTADPHHLDGVTIRDLLRHTSGIRPVPDIVFAEAYTGNITEDRFRTLLAEVNTVSGFAYANINFTLLGRVIGRVTGSPWQDVVRERVWAPAGMTRTTPFASVMYGDPNVAIPVEHFRRGIRPATHRKTDATMHAAGGVGTTAVDLARWLQINLGSSESGSSRILADSLLAMMVTPQTDVGTRFFTFDRGQYGLGWYIGGYQGEALVHHFGGYIGARAHVSFMPAHGIGVAAVINSSGPGFLVPDLVAMDVYDRLLGLDPVDMADERARAAARGRRSAEDAYRDDANPARTENGLSLPPEAYVGAFYHERFGTLRVTYSDRLLSLRLGAVDLQPVSTDPDRFLTTLPTRGTSEGAFVIRANAVAEVRLTIPMVDAGGGFQPTPVIFSRR